MKIRKLVPGLELRQSKDGISLSFIPRSGKGGAVVNMTNMANDRGGIVKNQMHGVMAEVMEDAPSPHMEAIEAMKNQLIIVLIKRLGGDINVPVSEIDGTGQDLLSMSLDNETQEFTFTTSKKN
tara:strand:+ start:16413 stop:16784 length:372 start_codon:yes stop_codon:yes gene_type:complete